MFDHLHPKLANSAAVAVATGGQQPAEDNRRQQGEGDGTFSHDWMLLEFGSFPMKRGMVAAPAHRGGHALAGMAATKKAAPVWKRSLSVGAMPSVRVDRSQAAAASRQALGSARAHEV